MLITPPNISLNSNGSELELKTPIGNVAKLINSIIKEPKDIFGMKPNEKAMMLAVDMTATSIAINDVLTATWFVSRFIVKNIVINVLSLRPITINTMFNIIMNINMLLPKPIYITPESSKDNPITKNPIIATVDHVIIS